LPEIYFESIEMKSTSVIGVLILCGLAVAQTKTNQTKSAPGAATTSVAMAHDPATAYTGQATVSADFNGDGILDLAFVNSTSGGVTVRLGKGDGTFAAGATFHAGHFYNAIVAGDFNGDGNIDLAVSLPYLGPGAGGFPDYLLYVFLGAGNGSFTLKSPPKIFYGMPLAAGDFNGDGNLDLITTTTDYYGDSWMPAIALGNGDGTFRPGVNLGDTYYLTYPAVGDLNGDGKLDIAMPAFTYYPYGNSITSVYFGNGNGTFAAPVSYSSPQVWATTAALGDFSGNGRLDIVTDGIQVLWNNGDGTFTNDTNIDVEGSPYVGGVAVGDFNGDGILDFAAGADPALPPYSAYIFLGDGNGKFQTVDIDGAEILQAADFAGNGKLDLLTTNGIYLQTPASLLPTYVSFEEAVNSVSAPQTLTLTNVGNTVMNIESLTLTGASSFSQTNTCGKSVEPGKSCQIQLVFAPTASGNVSAVISVTVPGARASTVTLAGYGYVPD
jgi:hypothetical protein